MGYFKRKLDRGRSRERIRRLDDEVSAEDLQRVWEAVPDSPPEGRFLRFATVRKHPASGRRTGVFIAAYELLEAPELEAATRAAVRDALSWFEHNLPVPDGFEHEAAVFLFKSDAGESIHRIWSIVRILREHGIHAEMQTIERPGKVLYEDEYQVAVVPWASSAEL